MLKSFVGYNRPVQMTNEHLYYRIALSEGIRNQDKYEQIFNGTITEQKRIIDILEQKCTHHISS